MADYTKEIEELKKQLAALGDASADIEERYSRAVSERERKYSGALAANAKTAEEKKKQASTKRLLDTYNYDRFAENRGLSASGESAQARLDLATIEANAVNAADSDRAMANSEALDSLLGDVSSLENEKTERIIEEKKDKENYVRDRIDKLTDLSDSGKKSEECEETEEKNDFTPELSPVTFAQELYKRYSPDDNGLTVSDNALIDDYLNTLIGESGLSKEYVNEVIFALRSKGYKPSALSEIPEQEREKIIDDARETGKKIYNMIYEKTAKDFPVTLAKMEASRERVNATLHMIYVNVYTREQFRTLAFQMGFTSKQLDNFDDYISQRGDNIRLKEKTAQ